MKLLPELVPETAWCENLRSELPKSKWDKLRRYVYRRADYRCEICDGVGPKHPVECHEVWEYDDKTKSKGVQVLVRLEALCPACHEVKHIGLAQIRGRYSQALKHMCKVNKMERGKAEIAVSTAFREWTKRSRMKWVCDMTMLDEIMEKIKTDED